MDKIHIDGQDFSQYADNLDDIQIDYGLNRESRTVTYSTGTDIVLTGPGFEYVRDKYFGACDRMGNIMKVGIYKACCDINYEFSVTYEGVEICMSECTATILLKRITDNGRCYNKLKSTILWKNGFAEFYKDKCPLIWYASQPGFLHWLIFFILPLIMAIISILYLIQEILEKICEAVFFVPNFLSGVLNSLFGSGDNSRQIVIDFLTATGQDYTDETIESMLNADTCEATAMEYASYVDASPSEIANLCKFIQSRKGKGTGIDCDIGIIPEPCKVIEFIAGTGKRVPSPLVKDILEYHAGKCGLKFTSSIFNAYPYSNITLFGLQVDSGRRVTDRYKTRDWIIEWLQENYVNWDVIQLLDKLKPLFNADYWIMGDMLVFERKDWFVNAAVNIGSIEPIVRNGNVEEYCVKYIQNNACSFWRGEYSLDAMDREGNDMFNLYGDIVDWNAGNDDWKRGECSNVPEFGAARFMFDRKSLEKDGLFDWDLNIDRFRAGSRNSIIHVVLAGPLSLISSLFLKCKDQIRTRDLIISDDRTSLPKLLILKQNYDADDAHVLRRQIAVDGSGNKFYDYNFPMFFDAEYPDPELYKGFHVIDNPNQAGREIYELGDVTIPMDCDIAKLIDKAQAPIAFGTRWGNAVVDKTSVVYNGTNSGITLSGAKIRCLV